MQEQKIDDNLFFHNSDFNGKTPAEIEKMKAARAKFESMSLYEQTMEVVACGANVMREIENLTQQQEAFKSQINQAEYKYKKSKKFNDFILIVVSFIIFALAMSLAPYAEKFKNDIQGADNIGEYVILAAVVAIVIVYIVFKGVLNKNAERKFKSAVNQLNKEIIRRDEYIRDLHNQCRGLFEFLPPAYRNYYAAQSLNIILQNGRAHTLKDAPACLNKTNKT